MATKRASGRTVGEGQAWILEGSVREHNARAVGDLGELRVDVWPSGEELEEFDADVAPRIRAIEKEPNG